MKKPQPVRIERQRESYRGASIIARAYTGRVKGKAWIHGREIASVDGVSEPDVLAALREQVDAVIVVETDPCSVPYPDDAAYRAALETIRSRLTERQRTLLQAHVRARRHAATGAALAESVGFPSWQSARQPYSNVGRALGEAMLFQPRNHNRAPLWMLIVAEPDADNGIGPDTSWTMRPQLVAALAAVRIDPDPFADTKSLSFSRQRG